jgi:hypothetical protein
MRNTALDDALKKEVYQQPALVPACPWLGTSAPAKPKLTILKATTASQSKVGWAPSAFGKAWLWLVQSRSGEHWTTKVFPAMTTSETWDSALPDVVAVSAVDRKGNVGSPAVINLKSQAR